MIRRDDLRAVLGDADLLDLREYPQPFQHRERVRQQRFTDMEARVAVFLQDVNVPSLFGQQGGDG